MPFSIDVDSMMLKGRKGDTGSMTFNFNKDISAYTVLFCIVENVGDTTPVIGKEFVNPTGTSVTVNLTVEDTEKLSAMGDSYGVYYWCLKLSSGNDFAQTLIPQGIKAFPHVHVYPEGWERKI